MGAWLKTHRSIAASILLMGMVGCLSLGLMHHVHRLEEADCFQRLQEAAVSLADEILLRVESDQQQLSLIAETIATQDGLDHSAAVRILRRYHSQGMMTRLQILLPGDILLLSSGDLMDVSGLLSFEEASALGTHISGKETDPSSGRPVLRNYAPITYKGETLGMLCGVVELTRLPELWTTDEFGGTASVYVIDGATGEFLLDTWHRTLGSVEDLGLRTMKEGFSPTQFGEDIQAGRSGYVAFVSRTIGDYLFLCYEPAGINRWMVALSVPESVVYQRAGQIQTAFWGFIALEAVCFLAYLAGVLRHFRREANEKQRRLDLVSYIYDVEKLLFTAHQNDGQMDKALARVAGMMGARGAFFETAWDDGERVLYLWRRPGGGGGHPAAGRRGRLFEALLPEREAPGGLERGRGSPGRGGRSAGLPPGRAAEHHGRPGGEPLRGHRGGPGGGRLVGSVGELRVSQERGLQLLHVSPQQPDLPPGEEDGGDRRPHRPPEPKPLPAGPGVLPAVPGPVPRACLKIGDMSSSEGFWAAGKQFFRRNPGGLQGKIAPSRGQKTRRLGMLTYFKQALACVYLDADGLHELNNREGHAAGDRMLQTVARRIQAEFGGETTYRLGGDEFLAIALDMDPETVARKVGAVRQAAEREGYHVSAGVQWAVGAVPVEELMAGAEEKMYAEKARYYAGMGGARTARQS